MTARTEVRLGSVNIAFEQRGYGAPLVLLHGGVSDRREWRRQLEDLSDEFTVVAWDAPGCGRSTVPPEHFFLSDCARCLAEFIEDLGLKRPHVAGLSFGGTLALELYKQRPDLPRTLILASAYTGWARWPDRRAPRDHHRLPPARSPDDSPRDGPGRPA